MFIFNRKICTEVLIDELKWGVIYAGWKEMFYLTKHSTHFYIRLYSTYG